MTDQKTDDGATGPIEFEREDYVTRLLVVKRLTVATVWTPPTNTTATDLIACLSDPANAALLAEVLKGLGVHSVHECRHEFGVTGKCLTCGLPDAACESLFKAKLAAEDGAMDWRRRCLAAEGRCKDFEYREGLAFEQLNSIGATRGDIQTRALTAREIYDAQLDDEVKLEEKLRLAESELFLEAAALLHEILSQFNRRPYVMTEREAAWLRVYNDRIPTSVAELNLRSPQQPARPATEAARAGSMNVESAGRFVKPAAEQVAPPPPQADSRMLGPADHDSHHPTCTWSIRGRHFRDQCTCGPVEAFRQELIAALRKVGNPRSCPLVALADELERGGK